MYSALGFAMEQGLDVVWWQLFEAVGRKASLAEVREWVEERASGSSANGFTRLRTGRGG